MLRFARQRSRIIGALATPVVFWLLLGSGLNRAFSAVEGAGRPIGYLEYFFPGTIVMIVLFTAVFTTFSVIEDRKAGFMQGVLAVPVPRLAIVLGKILAGACIATIQGTLLLAIWPLIGGVFEPLALVKSMAVLFVLGVSLTGLGLCMAWPMDSIQGFHALMNLVLMPMWFLSGAVFPPTTAPLWLQIVIYANPLTYGQSILRQAMGTEPMTGVSPPLAAAVTALFAVVTIALATIVVTRRRKDGRP
ncbi:MAG: multidrug ABC transporter permease [Phycisphaeraceae bacterium]|nr:multidrug ABC transporter permease [Phycisphaeraceae bacterium]